MLTTAGKDFVAAALGDRSGSRPAAADYLALTENTTSPAASDTVLTGEITTAGAGMIRGQATYAHTNGTATYTLSKAYTANGNDVLPKTIAKVGVFNAASAGTLVWSTLLGTTATVSASGDSLTCTQTITVS